jgi:zinc metalloprotease ZmpB
MPDRRGPKRPVPTTREPPRPDAEGPVRDWFDPGGVRLDEGPLPPEDAARGFLRQNAEAFRWAPALADLRPAATLRGPAGFSVRFTQEHQGLPVDATEVVVNLYADSRVHSVYNQYHYDIPPALGPDAVRVDAVRARQRVARLTDMFRHREIGPARLLVYRLHDHELRPANRTHRSPPARKAFVRAVRRRLAGQARPVEGAYVLAWELVVATRRPFGRWRFLVDAVSGRLVDVLDRLAYATGRGKVFDPNPIVTSGNPGLSKATPKKVLDGERVELDLEDLDPPGPDGKYRLDGTWMHVEDYDLPTFAEPTSKKARFHYSWTSRKFLDVMAYSHIDRFQRYLQADLGIDNVAAFSARVDGQGQGGADVSSADAEGISFGEGGVPDATDAMVILHEYGHVIQESIQTASSTGNHASGVSEGFPDFLAAVYYDDKHAVPAATRGRMFSWNFNATDADQGARTYDLPFRFGGPEWAAAGAYRRAAIWCSAMFELYRKLGGDSGNGPTQAAARDLAIRLHLAANFGIPANNATLTQVVQQLEAADAGLGGWRYADGLHRKVIRDTFARRGVPGYAFPAVDVYVFDGREGGYGTPDGLDAFAGVLWKQNFGDTPDIWVTAGVNAASAPLVPQVGQPAHVHVRVKNRGNAGSGPVTVRAFGAVGPAMRWPGDWAPLDPATPALAAANVPPLPAAGVVVGPFTWVPAAAGPASILVVVECPADPAVTQGLLANASVPHLDLVPFDNNLTLRVLAVLP